MLKAIALAILVAFPLAAPAQASIPYGAPSAKTYVQVKLGAVIPQHDDIEDYDSGLAFDLVFGGFLTPNVALEAGIGRFSIGFEDSGFVPELGATATIQEDASAVPVTATLKLGAPLADKAFLFGLAGAGLYFVSDSVEISAPGFQSFTDDDSGTAFGFHFGGGLNVQLAPRWTLGAELRYLISEVELYDVKANIDSLIVSGAVGYRF